MVESLSRRRLLVSVGALGLAGCAGTRRMSPFFSTITNTRPSDAPAATRSYADALPYASMLFWFEGQSRSLLVLGSFDPDSRLTWYSPSKPTITTYGPFIVTARGTEVELRRTDYGPGWSADVRHLVGKTLERKTIVADKNEATALLRSTFADAGTERIKLLDGKVQLARIDETVIADSRVRFRNSYWIDENTGLCRRTCQSVLPTMQPIYTETLKFPDQAT